MLAQVACYLRSLTAPATIDRHHQLLVDSGRILMLIGTTVITHQLGVREAASSNAELVLLAFILWLLGAALAVLSVVGRRFPRLAAAGAALATALRSYLLAGL